MNHQMALHVSVNVNRVQRLDAFRVWRQNRSEVNRGTEEDEDRYDQLRDLYFQEQRRKMQIAWISTYVPGNVFHFPHPPPTHARRALLREPRHANVDRAATVATAERRAIDEWRRILNREVVRDIQVPEPQPHVDHQELVEIQEHGDGDGDETERKMTISDFPNEMLIAILIKLNVHDLISCRQVSKTWNDIGREALGQDFFALKLALGYCDQKTLYNCRLVSKKWKAIASGLLREDARIRSEDAVGDDYFVLSDRHKLPSVNDRTRPRHRSIRIFSTPEAIKDLPVGRISTGLAEQILPQFVCTAGYQLRDIKLTVYDEDANGDSRAGRFSVRSEEPPPGLPDHPPDFWDIGDDNIDLVDVEVDEDMVQLEDVPQDQHVLLPQVDQFLMREIVDVDPALGIPDQNPPQPLVEVQLNPPEPAAPAGGNPLKAQWVWTKFHGLLKFVPNLRKLHLNGLDLSDEILAQLPGPQELGFNHKLQKLEELTITLPTDSNEFCTNILKRFITFLPDTLRSISIYSFRDSLHDRLPDILNILREFGPRIKLYHRNLLICRETMRHSHNVGDLEILRSLIHQGTVPIMCSQLILRFREAKQKQLDTLKTFLKYQSENLKSIEVHIECNETRVPIRLPKLPQLQTLIIHYPKSRTPPESMVFVPFETHQFPSLRRVDLRNYYDSQRLFTSCWSETVRSLTLSFGPLDTLQVERWDYVFPNLTQLNILSCPHGYLGFIFKYLPNLIRLSVHVTQEFQYENINSTLTGFNVPGREFLEFMDYFYQVDENTTKLLAWMEKLRVKTGSTKPSLLDMKKLKTLDITFGHTPIPNGPQMLLPSVASDIDVELHKPLSDPGVYMSLLLLEPLDSLVLNLTDFSEECKARLEKLHNNVQIW